MKLKQYVQMGDPANTIPFQFLCETRSRDGIDQCHNCCQRIEAIFQRKITKVVVIKELRIPKSNKRRDKCKT